MLKHRLVIALISLMIASPALALVDGDGERYYLIKANDIEWDESGTDNARSVAFTFGQYLGDRRVASSETEIGITVSDGTVENQGITGGSEEDWSLMHLGQFVSFQNTGPYRVQAKLGFAMMQHEVAGRSEQEFEVAYGAAAILGPVTLEFTQMGSDFRFLTAGFRF